MSNETKPIAAIQAHYGEEGAAQLSSPPDLSSLRSAQLSS
jgi:hypothetical protein